ncbi:tetratricopeptide repeat protein [Crossiella sp. CA-258035]|uniref:tetratricopeptide repeat protein n=1 Tax=Crossiella sp. CA-258035 TaxID=2981138 RepID=UPI0024BC8500|nr:tetratricopeptide repeat protein [Crossiella sp. CA-258035]WHT16094.1 tetratricopeptide repeat protein [Crossiella sp. CA-258035]
MSEETFALVRHWMSVRQPERALDALAQLPGEDAVGYPATVFRASALWMLDRNEEAARVAADGISRFGPDLPLLQVLGNTRHELGQWPAAEEALLAALHQDPEQPQLLCDYARLCLSAGQVDKAERLVARAAHHDPHLEAAGQVRAMIALARGQDAEAVRHSADTLAQDPDSTAARAMHGNAAAQTGDVDQAYRSFRAAAAAEPGNAAYVAAAREARVAAHPALRPLRLMYRIGPMKLWLGFMLVLLGLRAAGLLPLALGLTVIWVLYCVYSWVAPPLVRRWLERNR